MAKKLTSAIDALNKINENQEKTIDLLKDQIKQDKQQEEQARRDEIAADKGDKSKSGNWMKKSIGKGVAKGKAVGNPIFETLKDIFGLAALAWLSNPENVKSLKETLKNVFDGVKKLGENLKDAWKKMESIKKQWEEEGFFSVLDDISGGNGFLASAGIALAGLAALAAPFMAMRKTLSAAGKAMAIFTGANVVDDAMKTKAAKQPKPKLNSRTQNGIKQVQAKSGKWYDAKSTQGKAITSSHENKMKDYKKAKAEAPKNDPKLKSRLSRFRGLGALTALVSAADLYSIWSSKGKDDQWKKEQTAQVLTSAVGGMGGASLGAMVGSFGGPIGAAIGGVGGGILGSLGGDWLGEKLADYIFDGSTPDPKKMEDQHLQQQQIKSAQSNLDQARAERDHISSELAKLTTDSPPALRESLIAAMQTADKNVMEKKSYLESVQKGPNRANMVTTPTAVPKVSDEGLTTGGNKEVVDKLDELIIVVSKGMTGTTVIDASSTAQGGGAPAYTISTETQPKTAH